MSEWEHRYLNGNFYEVGNIYRCQDISINDRSICNRSIGTNG